MHYFIYPLKDSYIAEDSSADVILYKDSVYKNYGGDEILELKKEFSNSYSTSPHNVSRILIQFDYSDVVTEIENSNTTSPKYYLKLHEVEGQKELSNDYVVGSHPLESA